MTLFVPDMAGRLFLLILLFDTFQYIKAKDLPQPSLTVIPAVIKERDSVQLNCQTPPSVSECYFIMEGQGEFTLPSPCQQTLTGTLLVMWTGQISPAEVKIHCQYSATGSQFRSIYSEPSTVTIQDIPQLTVSSTVIRETESVQLSCETPPSIYVSHCYFYIEGEKNLPDHSCTQTTTGTELLKRAGPTFPAVVKVKCYYVVGKSHTSPFSNPVSVNVHVGLTPGPRSTLPPSTTVSPTEDTTVTPTTSLTSPLTPSTTVNPSSGVQSSTESDVESNSKEIFLLGQLWQAAVASGVGVLLVGLTAVCLCRRTKKNNSQRPTARQDDHRQYDLVSMGAVSSGVMVDSGDARIDSQITSVLFTFTPSGLSLRSRDHLQVHSYCTCLNFGPNLINHIKTHI
ncbi:uncharacterized protein LOC115208196 isoform X2 [Salmo trutta]|uniref:uncharacterized protein LOC115208196 isoform X2 n=1 Tax=Salmo trutta TaxID=8032 RepID=UPI0011315A4A|nr:uncharacterized protein LOC115208196 isoform X2 [Salmo trutta]